LVHGEEFHHVAIEVFDDGATSPLRIDWQRDDLCADLGKQGDKFVHGINAEANSDARGWLGFGSERVKFKDRAGDFGGEVLRA
jgi:hypothetical protein